MYIFLCCSSSSDNVKYTSSEYKKKSVEHYFNLEMNHIKYSRVARVGQEGQGRKGGEGGKGREGGQGRDSGKGGQGGEGSEGDQDGRQTGVEQILK